MEPAAVTADSGAARRRVPSQRDLLVVAAFTFLVGLCLWGEAWTIDEPFYLAIGRQILSHPLHPLSFSFNWFGERVPMSSLDTTPPVLGYVIAAALKISGGGEFATRALLLPFDLAAAWAVLALAARYLRRPLLPTLIVLAGPAWVVNMPHLMPERVMAGFAFPALWLAAVGIEDGDVRAWRASALLAGLALMSKYNAAFVLVGVAGYAWRRGLAPRRIALWLVAAGAGAGAYQLVNRLSGGSSAGTLWMIASRAYNSAWFRPGHVARSLLCFVGGCGVFIACVGAALKPSRRALALTGLAAALLFAPWFDIAAPVLVVDRATGFALAWGTLLALWTLASGPRTPGSGLWLAWLASGIFFQTIYWSVLARFIVFLLPPLTFWAAERLESRADGGRRLLQGGLALTALLGALVAASDWRFAWTEREFAREVQRDYIAAGRTVWCTSHWGLQEYLVAEGARQLDFAREGWEETRPGDVIELSRISLGAPRPRRPLPLQAEVITVDSLLPLRLMSGWGWTGQGGFYGSVMCFLPWSISREPLQEYTLLQRL